MSIASPARAEPHLSVGKRKIEDYLERCYPRKPVRS